MTNQAGQLLIPSAGLGVKPYIRSRPAGRAAARVRLSALYRH